LMEPAVLFDVVVDKPDAVGFVICGSALIEVDPMLKEDGSRDAGTIVGDAAAVHFDRAGSNQSRGRPYDSCPAGGRLDRSAAALAGHHRTLRPLLLNFGTADQRNEDHEASDE